MNFCFLRDFALRAMASRAHPSVDPSTDGKVVVCLVAPGGRELRNISTAESFLRGNVGRAQARPAPRLNIRARYLVDPASSHMLVSKIKPCMSKYKPH